MRRSAAPTARRQHSSALSADEDENQGPTRPRVPSNAAGSNRSSLASGSSSTSGLVMFNPCELTTSTQKTSSFGAAGRNVTQKELSQQQHQQPSRDSSFALTDLNATQPPGETATSDTSMMSSQALVSEPAISATEEMINGASQTKRPYPISVGEVNELLSRAGCTKHEEAYHLAPNLDHSEFVKQLAIVFRDYTKSERARYLLFLDTLRRYCDDADNLQRMLQPTISETYGVQDSVARALLLVDDLQLDVAAYLLEKMRRYSHQRDKSQLARQILQQHRYMPVVVDSQRMLKLVCDTEKFAGGGLRNDVIRMAPELVHDVHVQDQLVLHLLETLRSSGAQRNVHLTEAIFDCIRHLQMTPETAELMCGFVLTGLSVEDLCLIPAMVSLYLCSIPDDTNKAVVNGHVTELLNRMSDCVFTRASGGMMLSQSTGQTPQRSPVVSALDPLVERCQYSVMLMNIVLKYCAAVTNRQQLADKILVTVLLFGLWSLRRWQKRVADTLKALVKSEVVVGEQMRDQAVVLIEQFSSVLAICDLLILEASPLCRQFACDLYGILFEALADDLERKQHVVMSLCSHVNSNPNETTSSLQCLQMLAKDTHKLQPFAVFIQSRLEDMDLLSVSDVKLLMHVLCTLAVNTDDPGDTLLDELKIRFFKLMQIGSKRNLGVLGELALLTEMIKIGSVTESEIAEKFTFLREKCAGQPALKGLLFDELNELMSRCDAGIQFMSPILRCAIDEILSKYFTTATENCPFDTETTCGIVESDPDEVVRHVHFTHRSDDTAGGELPSLLAIVQRFMSCNDNQLNTDARELFFELIGAKLVLPTSDAAEDILDLTAAQQKLMVDTLFNAVNWIRQMLNSITARIRGCSSPSDDDTVGDTGIQAALLIRWRHLIQTQDRLVDALKRLPSFRIPLDASNTLYTMNSLTTSTTADTTNKPRGRKRKMDVEPDDTSLAQPGPSTSRCKKPTIKMLRKDQLLNQMLPISDDALLQVVHSGVQVNTVPTSTQASKSQSSLSVDEYVQTADALLKRPSALFAKSRSVFGRPTQSKSSKGLNLDNISEIEPWLSNMRTLIAEVDSHFLQEQNDSDGVVDGLMNERSLQLLMAVQHSVGCIHKLVDNADSAEREEVTERLMVKALPIQTNADGNVLSTSIEYLTSLHCTQSLSCAAAILALAARIAGMMDTLAHDVKQAAFAVCEQLLQREWEPDDYKLGGAGHVADVLKAYFTFCADPLATCMNHSEQLLGATTADVDSLDTNTEITLKTINSSTFLVYYRSLWETLYDCTQRQPDRRRLNLDRGISEAVVEWSTLLELFVCATQLTGRSVSRTSKLLLVKRSKFGHRQPVMRECIRQARKWVQLISSDDCGLNVLFEKHLSAQTLPEMSAAIRKMTAGRRMLFKIIDTIKSNKKLSASSLRQLDEMGRILDAQMVRLQRALRVAGVNQAFQVGRLKHKDIQGTELSSSAAFDEETPPSSYDAAGDTPDDIDQDPVNDIRARSSSDERSTTSSGGKRQAEAEVDLFDESGGEDEDDRRSGAGSGSGEHRLTQTDDDHDTSRLETDVTYRFVLKHFRSLEKWLGRPEYAKGQHIRRLFDEIQVEPDNHSYGDRIVIISRDGRTFYTHTSIVCALSPVLDRYYRGGYHKAPKMNSKTRFGGCRPFIVEEADGNTVYSLLAFVYVRYLTHEYSALMSLIPLADFLQIGYAATFKNAIVALVTSAMYVKTWVGYIQLIGGKINQTCEEWLDLYAVLSRFHHSDACKAVFRSFSKKKQ